MPARERPLHVGIVGCGVVATAYYMPFMLRHDKKFHMVAVCDTNDRRARLCARLFRVPYVYTDYYDMLAHADIEVVFILTGPGTHAEFAVAAAQSGKHFLLQKPMATTMDDANRIVESVLKHRVVAVIEPSDHSPLDPRYAPLLDLLAKGVLGDPYWFEFCMRGPDHYGPSLGGNPYGVGAFYSRDSGGILFDFPYAPTQIVTLLGPCKSVQGLATIAVTERMIVPDSEYDRFLETRTDPMDCNYWEVVVDLPRTQKVRMEAPDNVFSLYEMVSGWTGVFHAGRLFHPVPKGFRSGSLCIWGTEGNMVFGHDHFASVISCRRELLGPTDENGWRHFEQPGDFSKARWPIPPLGAFNYYEASTAHLYECIREGKQPVIDVHWGRHITEMMCGTIESARTGKRYEMTTTTSGLMDEGGRT